MEFREVLETRRSVRSFSSRPVPDDVIDRVIDAARIAPSGNNRQPWRFVVVRDEKKRKAIAEACYSQSFVAQAPVIIVCCAVECTSGYEPWQAQAGPRDVVIAVDHLILAARDEGLGTCWIGAFYPDSVRKIVNVPDSVAVVMVVPLGYPRSGSAFTKSSSRKPLSEIRFFETYGG